MGRRNGVPGLDWTRVSAIQISTGKAIAQDPNHCAIFHGWEKAQSPTSLQEFNIGDFGPAADTAGDPDLGDWWSEKQNLAPFGKSRAFLEDLPFHDATIIMAQGGSLNYP